MDELSGLTFLFAIAVALVAGFVKGAVGFAMPMIMISGLGSVMAPETALAALLLPTLFTNVFQAFRDGVSAALASLRRHWRYTATVLAFLLVSAQLVNVISGETLLLIVGIPVVVFALIQLLGVRFSIPPERRTAAELGIGGVAGFLGGMSGVWGPPTVLYLTALDTPKVEQLRVQGVLYGIGAVVLVAAHIGSGVLNAKTAPLSAILLIPALVGILVGFRVADRLDQDRFRRATLIVLVLAGLNLVRRAVFG